MTCPRCGEAMSLKQQIDFPQGPAKLVFECLFGHIAITEAPEDPPSC